MARMTFSLGSVDAMAWLRDIPDGVVDMAVTDVPYESLEKHRAHGTKTRLKVSAASSNEWFSVFPNVRFGDLFAEFYRVLAKNAHLYFFCDFETVLVAKPAAEKAGFRFRKAIVWDKKKIGMGYSFRARHEFVMYVEKGIRRLNDLGVPDVLAFERIKDPKRYPTEKPVELIEVFITQSSSPGQLVIDPFMGSGAAGVAALRHGRRFWGNDISEKALAWARPRLVAEGGVELPWAPGRSALSSDGAA